METKVTTEIRYSNVPESYVRPESERPKLSEVNIPVINYEVLMEAAKRAQVVRLGSIGSVPNWMDRPTRYKPGWFLSNSFSERTPIHSSFEEDQDHQCPRCNSHTKVSPLKIGRSCSSCHRIWFSKDFPQRIGLSGLSIARSGDRKDAVGLGGVTGIVRNTIDKSVAADRQKEIRGKKLKGPALNFDAEASSSSNCGSGTNQTPSDDTTCHDGKPLSQSPSSPTGTQATQEEHRIIIDEPSALNLLDRMRVTQEIRGKKLKGPALNFDTEASSSSNCGSGTNQTPSDDTSSHDGKPLSQSPSSPTNTQATQEEHRIIIDEPSALNLLDRMLEKIKKDKLMKPLLEGASDYVAKLNDVVIGTASAANIGLVGFAESGSSFSPTLSFLGVANATALVCAFTAIPLRPKMPEASRIMTKIGGMASSSSIVGAMGMFLPDNIAWASWVAAIIPAVAVALM